MVSYSSIRRCLYGQDAHDYSFAYAKDFVRKYKDEKKIVYSYFLDAHEATGEVVRYLDDDLLDYLTTLEKEGILKDATVMLVSDHGLHMSGPHSIAQSD